MRRPGATSKSGNSRAAPSISTAYVSRSPATASRTLPMHTISVVPEPVDRSTAWPFEDGEPAHFSYARDGHPTGEAVYKQGVDRPR